MRITTFLLKPILLLSLTAAVGIPELPPAARQAMTDGLAAAEREQWASAIASFAEAQRAAPFAPSVLFNLGLAHAKVGHDLAAIAWLHSYLAAASTSRDFEAVRERIQQLIARVENKIGQLSRVTKDVQSQLEVEGLQVGAVEEHAALAARASLFMGDRAGAEKVISMVEDADRRDALWAEVAEAVTEQREDLELARWAVSQIREPRERERILATISEVETLRSRPPGVSAELSEWQELARSLSKRDHGRAVEIASNADVRELPLRLLRIATDLGADYRRVRRLEAKYADN